MIELSLHSGEGTRSECRLQRGLQIEECYRYKLFSKLFVQSKHAVVRTTPITASDCFSWKGMQFFPVKSYTNQCAIFELHFTSQLGLLSTHKETHMKSWFWQFVYLGFCFLCVLSIPLLQLVLQVVRKADHAMHLPGTLRMGAERCDT